MYNSPLYIAGPCDFLLSGRYWQSRYSFSARSSLSNIANAFLSYSPSALWSALPAFPASRPRLLTSLAVITCHPFSFTVLLSIPPNIIIMSRIS